MAYLFSIYINCTDWSCKGVGIFVIIELIIEFLPHDMKHLEATVVRLKDDSESAQFKLQMYQLCFKLWLCKGANCGGGGGSSF